MNRFFLAALLTCPFLATASGLLAEDLTLRINDTEARPGETAALVVRTYAPRGVGQGQVCFQAGNGTASPFQFVEDVQVFSTTGDAVFDVTFDPETQQLILTLSSASGGINAVDGPLAAIVLRLDPDLSPDETFPLRLDLAESFLLDPSGAPIPIAPRDGELRVLATGDPYELAADGNTAAPGESALLMVGTSEIFTISSGRVDFLFDPSIVDGIPAATVDPRYGNALLTTELLAPGRFRIDFSSPDLTLNSIPGDLIQIHLPIAEDVPVGTISAISLDPSTSFLLDENNLPRILNLSPDVIEINSPELLFGDGFEEGDLLEWSTAVGGS